MYLPISTSLYKSHRCSIKGFHVCSTKISDHTLGFFFAKLKTWEHVGIVPSAMILSVNPNLPRLTQVPAKSLSLEVGWGTRMKSLTQNYES